MTATTATALTPDDVRTQYPLVTLGACTDTETSESGYCFIFDAGQGMYLVFVQNGAPVWMRYLEPGQPYHQVWPTPQAGGQAL